MAQRIDRVLENSGGANGNQPRGHVETGQRYRVHQYDGQFHRVPKDWRFPRIGVMDLWRQWWIGDGVRNVPPLRSLRAEDFRHLDTIPLLPEEQHGWTGVNKNKRRPARKIFADLKFLMKYMEQCVTVPDEITLASVDAMYDTALPHVFGEDRRPRDQQKLWKTVVHELQSKQAKAKAAAAAQANQNN